MRSTSVIGLFCEDIREEKSGQVTIVGIMPENLEVPAFPMLLPKLGVYLRVTFDPERDLPPIPIQIVIPSGPTIDIGMLSSELIEQSRQEAKQRGLPFAGLVLQGAIQQFMIPASGSIQMLTTIEGERIPVALLNVVGKQST